MVSEDWEALETAWLRRIEILAKMGALDKVIAAERADRTPFDLQLPFSHLLFSCIVKQSFEPDALRGIIATILLDTSYNNTDSIAVYIRIKFNVKGKRYLFMEWYEEERAHHE